VLFIYICNGLIMMVKMKGTLFLEYLYVKHSYHKTNPSVK